MSPQTFFVLLAMILVGMAWYANSSKRNKIYCSFTRVNKTSLHKFVKMTSRYVVFDGKRYDIISSCVVFDWWDKGLVHMFFPQWVASLNYTYASRWPIDPSTGAPTIITPEVRKLMDKEEMFRDYNKTLSIPAGKKQSMIQQYLPWVAVLLVLVIGVYLFVNLKEVATQLAIMQNAINAITK